MKYVISATAILLANVGVFALPQGGRVEAGKGNLDNPAHIIQESQHLQTRWNSFDIGATEQVRIEQPNAQASINIKVRNGGATTINGTLTANGRVSLENPAGIQFGENSVVNVGGLLASSANGAVTSLGQVSAAEAIRFQGLSSESIVNVGGNVSAQEIIVEGNGDIVIGNSAHFTASQQVLIGGGYQGKDSSVLNSRTTDVKAAAQINAPRVIVWSDKVTRFLGRINAGRGFVEVSGKQNLIFPDISRVTAGKLLLDPADITIYSSGQSRDDEVAGDGILRADEFAGTSFNLGAPAIQNYAGDVSVAASGTLTVNFFTPINKTNGSLILSAPRLEIFSAITISGAGHYLSFELTGTSVTNPFTFSAAGAIIADDVRLAINYTDNTEFVFSTEITNFFAAAGRTVTIEAPANIGVALNNGLDLCAAGNTGCGDLTVSAGAVSLAGTFAANNINLTVAAGAITFTGTPTITATTSITLTQADVFPDAEPADFGSVTPFIARTSGTQGAVNWANLTVAANITITDGNLTTALTSKGIAASSQVNLGSLSLMSSGMALDVPAGITGITTTGTISITGGLTASAALTLTADTITFGGAINFGVNALTLNFATSLGGGTTAPTLTVGSIVARHTGSGPVALPEWLFTGQDVTLYVAEISIPTATTWDVVGLGFEGNTTITGEALTLTTTATFIGSTSAEFTIDVASFSIGSNMLLLAENLSITSRAAGADNGFNLSVSAAGNLTLGGHINAGTGTLALSLINGKINFTSNPTLTGETITLKQDAAYDSIKPANFSTPPTLTSDNSFNKPAAWGVCGTNCFDILPGENLDITDGVLDTAVAGKFNILGTTLDLGAFNLTASGMSLTVPAGITSITTTGTISIMDGLIARETLTLTADTITLGGAINFGGVNNLFLNFGTSLGGGTTAPTLAVGSITATHTGSGPVALPEWLFTGQDVTLSVAEVSIPTATTWAFADLAFAVDTTITGEALTLTTSAPFIGSGGFDLTIDVASFSVGSDMLLLGKDISVTSSTAGTDNSFNLILEAVNNLTVAGHINAGTGTLTLEATNGKLTFTSNPTITGKTITLVQQGAYDPIKPANFSTPPILGSGSNFNKPAAWGVCGDNCLLPLVPANLVIADGNLETALAGKFAASGGRLDLGTFSLTSSGDPLVIPAGITTIVSGGTISITGGLTAEGDLSLLTDTMELGGTFTTSTGRLEFGSFDETLSISAVGDLTFNSHVVLRSLAHSLGSSGFNLTLDSVDASSASFVLSGNNITLNGAFTGTQSITITADNDLFVNDTITVTNALALTATAGGITFDSTSTAITAASIALTQADAYGESAPATFNNPPTLNSSTSFTPPSWGVCGDNCTVPVPANLVITDGNLEGALVDKFEVSGTTLDLGAFNLTASGMSLTIPSTITRITTTGTISITGGLTATAALNLDTGALELGGTLTTGANTLTLTSANAITAGSALVINSALTMAAPSLGSAGADLTLSGNVTGSTALALRGDNITLGSLNLSSGILEVTADDNIVFTSSPTITAAEVFLTWAGNTDFGTTAPADFTDGTNTILPSVEAANQTAATWFQLPSFSLNAGSDNINFFEVVTLTKGSETMEASVDENGILNFGDNIIRLTTTDNIIFPGRLVEIRARRLTITAATIARGAQALPFSRALAITTTEDLELNGNLAMDAGIALDLSFGGSLRGAPTLTATNLGITSTGSDAVTLPSWVFGDDTRQLRLNVAAITLVADEVWVAESVTLGENTTITSTSRLLLNVPTLEAGANTLTMNVKRIDFLAGAAVTITAGTVSLTTIQAAGEPSDTPSLTITATTGNLTLDGRFNIGVGAMILTATQGEIVFTSNSTFVVESISLTQDGAAFSATTPATFRSKVFADVRPTIRYTGGVQLPVDWAVEISAEPIAETDGGGYNIDTLLNTGEAFAAFETTRGILDFGETDLILETANNITIPARITQIRARTIIIRAGIFGRGSVAAPAALNADIEFVATGGIVFRADIQSGNKITFTGARITFSNRKTTRISASEIVIATTGTPLANNQNVFLEATGNITIAGNVDVGLGSLIINAGGSIVTTAATSLRGNKISYNPAVVVRNANDLTLTAYDDIYLPGVNLNNADGALSLTAGGSIVTGSARSILGTTIGFKQGQARYETGRLLLRAFTGALTIDAHLAHDMITLRVSDPALLDLTDAILEGEVSAVTQ